VEIEEAGDEPVMADALAQLARARMRSGLSESAVEAADRSLAIAERLNLEPIVAEAFINKSSGLGILGRRRESVVLARAALELAQRLGLKSLEMRVRNNLASALFDDEPAEAARTLEDALELSKQVGDRGMYFWLAGTLAASLHEEGRDWDAHEAIMREAFESATLRSDRARLLTLGTLFATSRGDGLEERPKRIREVVGDSSDPDELFQVVMTEAATALLTGDPDTAYSKGVEAADLLTQNPEVGLELAMRAAIWSGDLDRARTVSARVAVLAATGQLTEALRLEADAAVAALEGRRDDAVAGFTAAATRLRDLSQMFTAAVVSSDAAVLLPNDQRIRALAAAARPLLEELRARPYLEKLDQALGSEPAMVGDRSESRAETPTA
jgi:hypothetical protein